VNRVGAAAVRPVESSPMITGLHTLLYADDPEAARAFLRDVLEWPFVDAHDGWLIFRSGPSEIGLHPAEPGHAHHEISFMCDDVEATVAQLVERGAEFDGPIESRGFGRTIGLRVPGAGTVLLYEPRHPTAVDL
jgi:predicted enzyme related to lactoylglutathione lyase